MATDSPADKAGLKVNDVLVSYDDQRLYSPEQFVKLIRYDKPDRKVKLGVIHDGKLEDIGAVLGEQLALAEQQQPTGIRWPMTMRAQHPITAEEEEANLASFDSLTLSRTDKNHYKVEIKYRDDKGKLETHDFQGLRDQIRNDIDAEKDLPANERDQLLRAISLSRNPWETSYPFVEFIPDNRVLWDFIESSQHQAKK